LRWPGPCWPECRLTPHFGNDLATRPARGRACGTCESSRTAARTRRGAGRQRLYLYYGEMNYPAAQQELERVHARWPNNAEALEALGLILRRQGRTKEAETSTSGSSRSIPLVPVHRAILASLLEFHRMPFAFWTLRFGSGPDNGSLLANKAATYQHMGELDLAAAVLRNVHARLNDLESIWGDLEDSSGWSGSTARVRLSSGA